ncbi:MAG: hypothetical protein JNK29_13300 [Anaerolineales bacterium]|nr:hypothetical protein [Anaerolineales bacterium]
MFPKPALPPLRPPIVRLPSLAANPYLAEARRRFERLAAQDLTGRWAEARRWRLAEAWRAAQANLPEFERELRAKAASLGAGLPAAPPALEALRAAVLTHYCANILHYQAALGKRPGIPSRPVPVEWVQMAAAAAIVAVIQTALMVWVLHRPARRSAPARRRPAPVALALCPRVFTAPRAVCLPLRL